MSPELSARLKAYWLANQLLIAVLLVIWALVSFGAGILFVEPLNAISFFGLPLGFFMAQQGSIFVFVVLIFAYAIGMDWLDRRYHADED
jgi:putative solute:sodium symporter small subunit